MSRLDGPSERVRGGRKIEPGGARGPRNRDLRAGSDEDRMTHMIFFTNLVLQWGERIFSRGGASLSRGVDGVRVRVGQDIDVTCHGHGRMFTIIAPELWIRSFEDHRSESKSFLH